jgi:hypothetical protein
MERQIKFFKTEVRKTPNWKDGIPKEENSAKNLCVVTFMDGAGNLYTWTPEKWETNLLIGIARNMVRAEELNFPLLKNPERRLDIEDLRAFLNPIEEVKE